MLCVSILSGCSLVTTDYSAYYNAIVASATTENGKKIEITKKDLLVAYNSYGFQYSSYYGMTQEEAVKKTLEGLVALGFDKTQVYTTLELRMKCGVGKCGRCNVGAKYVCKDGPVFRCDELEELPSEY